MFSWGVAILNCVLMLGVCAAMPTEISISYKNEMSLADDELRVKRAKANEVGGEFLGKSEEITHNIAAILR